MKKKKETQPSTLPFNGEVVIVQLKNLRDYPLKNVQIFNHDFEKQNKIEYDSYTTDFSYKNHLMFMSSIRSAEYRIKNTMVISTREGQLDQTIKFINKTDHNNGTFHIACPTLNILQNQTDRVLLDNKSPYFNGLEVVLSKLLYNSTVTFRFYLEKNNEK